MQCSIQGHPELGTFDSAEVAIARAWEITPPGESRPKLVDEDKAVLQSQIVAAMRAMRESFILTRAAAEKAAHEMLKMSRAMDGAINHVHVTYPGKYEPPRRS